MARPSTKAPLVKGLLDEHWMAKKAETEKAVEAQRLGGLYRELFMREIAANHYAERGAGWDDESED